MQTYWLEEAMADGGDVVTQGIGGGMRSTPRLHPGIGYVFARLAPNDSAGGDHRGAEGTVGTSDGTPVIQRAPDAVELAEATLKIQPR